MQELHQAKLLANDSLDHKNLGRVRGVFIHLQRTYPVPTPFLKGMHLTLDGWRENRDYEMWAVLKHKWETSTTPPPPLTEAPKRVVPAPRLKDDLHNLAVLLSPPEPPTRIIRAS